MRATTLVFFAYLGFEQIASLSEEAKDARKSVPLGILVAIAVTTALYIAVAIASVRALGWEKLGQSQAPLADAVEVSTGARVSLIIAVIVLFATASTVLFLQMISSRLMYGMSASGTLPRMLSAIHSVRKTPSEVVEEAGADERASVDEMLPNILPVSQRQQGLMNDAAVTSSLPSYELERTTVPTLAISVADDLFGTLESARYSAQHIPNARFVGYESGGHLWVGHHQDVLAEIAAFLR